jgi:D-amino-acid dehydrogenase
LVGELIVVVGAGVAGASVAARLSESGADVVVVDDLRRGRATLAGAGIVSPPVGRAGVALFELVRRAVRDYPKIVGGGSSYEVVGELCVSPSGRELDELESSLASSGVRGVERLTEEEAREAFPYLAKGLAAVQIPGTARVNGETLRRFLLQTATSRGAEVLSGPAVLVGDRRVECVMVGERRLTSPTVVIAGGAWSGAALAPLGYRLPLFPQRGQIVHLEVQQETGRMPVVSHVGSDHYMLTFPLSRVVVGATRESSAGWQADPTADGVLEVLRRALAVAPGLGSAVLVEVRVGLRPATPDGMPLLGPVPEFPGVWLATGMGPAGLTLGPYCGQLVADCILGQEPDTDIAPFRADRFTDS